MYKYFYLTVYLKDLRQELYNEYSYHGTRSVSSIYEVKGRLSLVGCQSCRLTLEKEFKYILRLLH